MDTVQLVSLLSALVALLFTISLKTNSRKKTLAEPPEPERAWPILGHLGLLVGTVPLHRTLARLSDRHGPVFALRLGQKRAVVVSTMDLARECLSTNDRALAGRPQLVSSTILGYEGAMFGFASYGPFWRDMRKVTTMELLSSRRLDLLKHVRLEEIGSLVKGLYDNCRDGKPVELTRPLSRLTINIIVRMVAGKRYFHDGDRFSAERGREFIELVEEFFFLLGVFTVSDALPWLHMLDIGGHVKAMKRVRKRMDEYADSWVAEHRRRSTTTGGGREDDGKFVGALLLEVGDDDKSAAGVHPDTIVKGMSWGLISAGSGTTSDTLMWAVSLLLNNRRALMNAQDELDVHVGKERQVDESDLSKLTYLDAIVKESMRLYPGLPLLPHESMEPVRIGGYDVPVGTMVLINSWKIQRDPNLWPDADEFKPERFMGGGKETASYGFHQSMGAIPFGSGRRSCPGSILAKNVLSLTLARLIQGFEWSTSDDGPIDMTEGSGLTLPKQTPLMVSLRPRLASHLY